jgi:membrane peptidoglycan carboxypeptidase
MASNVGVRAPLRLNKRAIVLLALLALTSGIASWYAALPGVGDAPRRAEAQARAHREPVWSGPPPARLAQAVVSIEDKRFWRHGAIDPIAIGRAALATVRHPGRDPGGSTIAQQLAKVLYVGAGGPLSGARAIGLAFKLEHRFGKPRILGMYLNAVYLGHGYWGMAAASRGYFGTTPDRLSWGEAALLAGLPQSPSADDPILHYAAARARQREVLDRLVADHVLSSAQAASAYAHTPRPWSGSVQGSRSSFAGG